MSNRIQYNARLFRDNYDGPRFPYQGKSGSSRWNATWIPNPYPPGTVSQKNFRVKVAEEFVDVISGQNKKKLFSGLYGTGFLIDQSLQLVPMLRQSTYPRKTIDPQPAVQLAPKEKILMKVQLLDSREREEEAFQEDATLEAISNGVVRYHGLEICGRDFVPRFIFGCTMPYTTKDNVTMYFRLTFMTYIKGQTLYDHMKTRRIGPILYARLEKAFTMLWMMGYAHNDAHLWNIMIESGQRPYIIDFGMARKLNRSRHDLFMENLSVLASNNAFNKHFLDPMASEMFYEKNLPFMNVDSRILRSLRRTLNPCDVAKARQKVWASPTNNKNPISERLDVEREAACTRKRSRN